VADFVLRWACAGRDRGSGRSRHAGCRALLVAGLGCATAATRTRHRGEQEHS